MDAGASPNWRDIFALRDYVRQVAKKAEYRYCCVLKPLLCAVTGNKPGKHQIGPPIWWRFHQRLLTALAIDLGTATVLQAFRKSS